MAVRIDISPCDLLNNPGYQENFRADWVEWSPDRRRQVYAYFRSLGALAAVEPDFGSSVAPVLFWPPGHGCNGPRAGVEARGGVSEWEGPDEGARARAAAALAAGAGVLPLPGLGLLGPVPSWLKWAALAALAAVLLAGATAGRARFAR